MNMRRLTADEMKMIVEKVDEEAKTRRKGKEK